MQAEMNLHCKEWENKIKGQLQKRDREREEIQAEMNKMERERDEMQAKMNMHCKELENKFKGQLQKRDQERDDMVRELEIMKKRERDQDGTILQHKDQINSLMRRLSQASEKEADQHRMLQEIKFLQRQKSDFEEEVRRLNGQLEQVRASQVCKYLYLINIYSIWSTCVVAPAYAKIAGLDGASSAGVATQALPCF